MERAQAVEEHRPHQQHLTDQTGRLRVMIEGVKPEVDSGRFPIKRVVGEEVVVEADIFVDGHDLLSAVLLYRREEDSQWSEVPMKPLVNDRWRGKFQVDQLGHYRYTIKAWVDEFKSWRQGLSKKVQAGQDVSVDLMGGAPLIAAAGQRATIPDARSLLDWADTLQSSSMPAPARVRLALSDEVAGLVAKYPERRFAITYTRELAVVVDRERARFSTWYEMFPRSCAPRPGQHGTFKDCEARLPYIAEMCFDVLYLPPIHPIGTTQRKGKNNSLTPTADDTGVPWAIGSTEGGHKSVHPELGTLEDFRHFVAKAREYGIDVALDVAFQCSPDHPYVREHTEWFRKRPDGTIQYAENPPKRYEDIYPFDFETEDWSALWEELKSIFLFWADQGVHIFRVDNPHTKAFPFWEWVIAEIKKDYPDAIFLSEAFTRPKVMYRLAKLGFTQSYTYFAWRNTKWELTQYFTELTQTDVREFFRPNPWPNTPDILTEYLQTGGRPAFMARLALAATLGANYGIYGPAYELCENRSREHGSEEYLDSEKYQIRNWDLDDRNGLKEIIAVVNRIRRENPALQSDWSLLFHPTDNDHLICYSKQTEDLSNIILVVVNVDPYHTHSGWVDLSSKELGLSHNESFQVHDLLTNAHYLWQGHRNYVELNPHSIPAHIFRLNRRVRSERDFDYYM
ncbi:MAG TPA: alpha-1,4-glucan--maltose-1-phosphate maltosyltransferase [Dehalococcoidia bacterium]|nr:alpha-1,4-glucan--maltose-1-phosphate maltosyltransferase [Dehalococcoidia bacterium]